VERLVSLIGFLLFIAVAWLLSLDRRQFPWRIVVLGCGAQFIIAALMLNTKMGKATAESVIWLSRHYYSFIDRAAVWLVGEGFHEIPPLLQAVPAILFIAALAAVLYHFRIAQLVVQWLAALMQPTFGISGAESLVGAGSFVLGRVEALFLVRPYLNGLTSSELHTILVFGFATISLSVLGSVGRLGISDLHLVTASLISVPAGLVIAKVLVPETQIPATLGRVDAQPAPTGANSIDALVHGVVGGLKVAVRVIAVAIVIFALLAMLDRVTVSLGIWFGYDSHGPGHGWALRNILKYAFSPLAMLMGVPSKDVLPVGELLGLRLLATEFEAYAQLQEWLRPTSGVHLEPRSQVIVTYALCGFANFITVGMQVAAVGALAPERQVDAARLIWRALLGGLLASCMTASVAGVLV
jgi:concentrative nucleoside transporter, CNT family